MSHSESGIIGAADGTFRAMDTIIFAGLLVVVVGLYRRRSRRWVLAGWWLVLVLTLILLRHHITSGLGLGLTW
ncbi:DUF5993 family protein [Nocardia pseudobrasiliensis]|uniref:Uncharacterized protein n=1 Tax=Nocardia pseudobrasiliensis TaxID=45979 RepID=A0A370HT36_9NOCA|nr:DUF5993 family protein [Nocardia pseudobrasiliensis]RDI61460.1 hypothetical protein DFR76_114186 [Nocardia pseudobrasiliensis]